MKKSKVVRQKSKYKWDIVQPYLDVIINNGSRNRKVRFITLREFKELAEFGLSSKDIILQGISKHLVNFYSNLSQGKISLDQSKFVTEYESGLALNDIADKYDISHDNISFLRQLYDIKAKGATFQERKRTETAITQRQKEILYGSMLGDAKRVSDSAAGFVHGDSQKDYLMWKYKEFENISSKHSLQGKPYTDKRSGREGVSWKFYTLANSGIEECVHEFYKSGKKEVTRKILDQLTPLSVAVWFQDDGKTDFHHRSMFNLQKQKMTPSCCFCTDSFSHESCELIKGWFNDKFSIKVRLKEKMLSYGLGYRIIVENDDTVKFLELIRPFILPMFLYKTNYEKYVEEKRPESNNNVAEIVKCPLGKDFSNLQPCEQDLWIDKIVQYWRNKSFNSLFIKPKYLKQDMKRVFKYDSQALYHDECIGFCNVGNQFLSSHFKHFWQARAKGNKSPQEVFENDRYLSEIVRSVILDNKFPKARYILHKLRRYRGNKSISGFMPCIAKAIYDKYALKGSRVIDFCAGFGGRLFGAFASQQVSSYTGVDISPKNHSSLLSLHHSLMVYSGENKEIILLNQDAVVGMKLFASNSFDLCLTSVPYFDAEEYDNNGNQSYLKYQKYSDWFEKFFLASINEAMRISNKVLINVANTGSYLIADDFRKWLNEKGILFVEDKLRFPRFGGKYFYEPLFIVSKDQII